jgi:hypothetical protein
MAHTIEDQHDDAPQGSRPAEAAEDAPPARVQTTPTEPEVEAPPGDPDVVRADGGMVATAGAATAVPRPRRTILRPVRQGSRRTRVVVRRVGPLSVLKFSLIFYFCVMLIVFFALAIIYAVLSAAGAMEEIGKLLGYFFGTGNTGTRDPEPIKINGGVVFTWLFFAGLVFTVVWSVINVFVAFLYNLISDIVGGIDVTLAEKPPR